MNIATIEVSGVYASAKAYTHIPAGLVGATVIFEFTDPRWDSLRKTAVFRGNVTRDVIMSGDIVRLPPETVETPGGRLLIGVYGVDSDENIVIPTLWTDIGPIRAAADPSGDPSVDPELPVWAQLQDEIEKLKQNTPEGPEVPGQDGEDGGYYTPSLTQPDDNTLEFQFTPSKPDMPAVDPVQVELPHSGGNVNQGTGWTSEQIEILDSIGDHINFLDSEGGRLWDSLITALRSGQGSSAVLTSITAVYSGGSVEAGTLTRELKIIVTATYDDGTSKPVTGYTLSPSTVSEGENTVTVNYNGKTSTFNVVGIVTPVEAVLESISAVFNGENAQAGTNASDLDITVTGHYSDGSTKTETGWTSAGIVTEGDNVFTIYLGDKTCTVSVVGVAVEEDMGVGVGTKIARFEGQTSGSYGAATFNSALLEDNKLYAFILDPSTSVSAYSRINLFGFIVKNMDGNLKVMAPNYNFTGSACNIAESDGVVTLSGTNMNKFYAGTFYDLYEVGTEDQLITDGQLFDYVGTIEPTTDSEYENTLTIPASALTDDSYFAVILRSWNTEINYLGNINTYGRTPMVFWGFHSFKYQSILVNGQNMSENSIRKNDDGSWSYKGSSGLRLYANCNLVFDVYRANPTWG